MTADTVRIGIVGSGGIAAAHSAAYVGRFVGVPGQGMGYRDGFTIGVSKALGAIGRGETSADRTFMDGLQVALVVDAALQSARSKTWQPVRRASELVTC